MAAQTPLRTGRLLLTLDTNITCPSCAHEFSLEEGFAKKALERLEDASAGAIAALREAERAEVEKRAQQLAGERARAAQNEAEALKKLLKEQGEGHAKAIAEVRSLAPRASESAARDRTSYPCPARRARQAARRSARSPRAPLARRRRGGSPRLTG